MSKKEKNVSVEASENAAPQVSKSKAKREARKAEVKSEKAKSNVEAVIGWIIGILIAAVIIYAIGMGIYQSANKIVSDSNYSQGLTAAGFIEGAKLNSVTDFSPESMKVPFSEVEYTDDEVQSDIDQMLNGNKYYDTNPEIEIADGDTINLDYVGSVDGEEFEGGNTNGAGTTLVIGSGTYIDTFEQQLIGSHPGDAVTVNVTFPDPYDNNPDLAGKEAVFECVINSKQMTPEFTDEFVKEHYSELASTTDELREYAKSEGYKSKLYNYISNYITENAAATSVPKSYEKHLQSLLKYSDEQNYNYYNSYYEYYLGSAIYDSFEDYTGKTAAEYDDSLREKAHSQAVEDLTYEYYFNKFGLTVSDELSNDILNNFGGENATGTYGEGYINQVALKYAVIYHLADVVTVE